MRVFIIRCETCCAVAIGFYVFILLHATAPFLSQLKINQIMNYHYLNVCPIKDFKIAKECEAMLLGTTEKKERRENITNKLKSEK